MKTTTRRKVAAMFAVGAFLIGAAGCGKSGSSSDRDRNVSGGIASQAGDNPAPYQAVLYRFDETKEWTRMWGNTQFWGFQCSAVIIAPEWLVTLNSCVSTFGAGDKPYIFHIGVGKLNAWAPTLPQNVDNLTYGVSRVYSGSTSDQYALIKTDRPIVFSETVLPIDLPFGLPTEWPTKGTTGQISGWGSGDGLNPLSSTLRTANVEVANSIGDTSCGNWQGYVAEIRLCLGKSTLPTGGLACSYDQGGPVVVNVANRPVLAGLIAEVDSSGGCKSGQPTLAVRMTYMVGWLASGRVSDLTATPDDGSVTLSWSKPWNGGGPEVYDYVIELSEDGKTWDTLADGENPGTEVTFSDLQNGKEYSFRVAALNELIAVRPDQRIYSDVVTVKVGRQQPPAMVDDVGDAGPPPTAATAPELPGGTDSFVEKPMADPSAPSTTVPSSNVVTTAPSAPTTTEAKVAPAAVSTQLSTTTPIDVVSVAKTANITIPTGALVKMSVEKSAKKICAVQGSALVALKAGNCKVKVTVSVKGKKQSKSATISVAR